MTTDEPGPPRDGEVSADGTPQLPVRQAALPLDLEAVAAALDAVEAPELAAPTWASPAAHVVPASAPPPQPGPTRHPVRGQMAGALDQLVARMRSAIGFGEAGTLVWPERVEAPPPRGAASSSVETTLAPAPETIPDLAESPETLAEVALVQEALENAAPAFRAPVITSEPPTRRWQLPFPWNAFIAVLTGVETLSILMFVLMEPTPRWVLLVGTGVAVAGTDGVLRATYREPFEAGADTTPYLFLPALYAFAAPLVVEHNATGYAVLVWGLVAGAGFGAITVAEVMSVRTGSRAYPYARLVASAAAYFAAFALLAAPYLLHLGLPSSIVAAWLVCAMLGVELLREGEIDPLETAIFAGTAALVVAQARWLLFFVPLDGYVAGLTLLLVFFLVIGVLHAHVMRQLTAIVAGEYIAIAALGIALVVAARAVGIA